MPEINTADIEYLLEDKYYIDLDNVEPEDIPQIVTHVMTFVEESLSMTPEQKKKYVVSTLITILKNTKLTAEEKEKMDESIKTLVESYEAVSKTAKVIGLLSKKNGACCVIC